MVPYKVQRGDLVRLERSHSTDIILFHQMCKEAGSGMSVHMGTWEVNSQLRSDCSDWSG